ncbi:MAG: hypothetical protein GY930_06185 [bacterium]|nr:hypothetical protein [bacterium]
MKHSQITLLIAALAQLTPQAQAQSVHFSVDWRSPSIGLPDSGTGIPITSGDILTAAAGAPMLGPLLTPATSVPHALPGLGLFSGCVGAPPGAPCPVEVDAFSFGIDDPIGMGGIGSGALKWSVDGFATGFSGTVPNVVSEAPVGDSAADVMLNMGSVLFAPAPPAGPLGHRGLVDGNGLISGSGFTYPGFGLIEPTSGTFAPAETGDNMDALDILPPGVGVLPARYFSLDSGWIDPLTGLPHNITAPTHGFSGSDVLFAFPASLPMLYAPAGALGLDIAGGFDSDDLDALMLWENGDGMYMPSHQPFDWIVGSSDMLLFSVRRGSAVIGMPDSIFGIPIEAGDILTTPLDPTLGGLSPFPGIFVAAELLGLNTVRSGMVMPFGDDLNALDHFQAPFSDCNGNGVDDMIEIAYGISPDLNSNGVLDGCEGYVTCTPYPNSTGVPTLLTGTVTGSPGSGLHLEATSGPAGQFGYFLIGTAVSPVGLPVGSGNLCLASSIARYNVAGSPMNSIGLFDAAGVLQNLAGTSTVGSGFDVPSSIPGPIGGTLTAGLPMHFQLWHRDVGMTSNFSNSISY